MNEIGAVRAVRNGSNRGRGGEERDSTDKANKTTRIQIWMNNRTHFQQFSVLHPNVFWLFVYGKDGAKGGVGWGNLRL